MSNFVDECNINVKGGDGGAGCVAFRREAHVAKGGPDGGDGGDGGSIWLVADRNVASLLAFRDHPHRKGENGSHGSGSNRHGARRDLEVQVPEGTVVLIMQAANRLSTSFTTATAGWRLRPARAAVATPASVEQATGTVLRRTGRAR